MKIYAARHGQTRWNVKNIVCGRSDIPLTAEGEKQAQALADIAADCRLDVIIASPMIRAQQTARAVADRCGIDVLTDERLIEQSFGIFEGASRDDETYQQHKRKYFHKHGGGESMMQLARSERVIRQENTVRIIAPEGMRLEGEGQGRGLDVRGDVAEAGVLNAGAI